MIELVFRELRHEIDAYEDFRRFRKELPGALKRNRDPAAFAARLERRRKQLMARMRRRRAEEHRRANA
jgi:hypothetical protein